MFNKVLDKGITLAVCAGGQLIGNTLYDLGYDIVNNFDLYKEWVKNRFRKEEEPCVNS